VNLSRMCSLLLLEGMFYKYLVHHEDQSTNEIETKSQTRKQIEKINEIESWFFEKIKKKKNQPLSRIIKKRREGPKSLKAEMQRKRYKEHHRNTKGLKRLLQTTTCQ